MSKITKNERINALEQQVKGLIEDYKLLSRHVDCTSEYEPKLKQLDQSVFDGLDEKWRFAAVDKNGSVYKFRFTPKVSGDSYFCDEGYHKYSLVGTGYDTSNWQNSLIERESRELTGSDLVRAMLARGDKYVMCRTGDGVKVADVADSVRINTTDGCRYRWVTPINNQGEPLTQAEAGL